MSDTAIFRADRIARPASAFNEIDAFRRFKAEVSLQRRFFRSASAERFLQAVAETCRKRLLTISAGEVFWRAQIGHDWITCSELGKRMRGPHREMRMKPLQDRAYEGRVNPKGIPCLYFATTRHVAMSEVRPWIGSVVSVARFRTQRPLTVVDCSVFHDAAIPALVSPSPDEIERIVWTDIDQAFSTPITRSDNTADYAATQTLGELFRSEGYDGILYKSAFGAEGYNAVFFDLDCASQIECSLFEVRNAVFDFAEIER